MDYRLLTCMPCVMLLAACAPVGGGSYEGWNSDRPIVGKLRTRHGTVELTGAAFDEGAVPAAAYASPVMADIQMDDKAEFARESDTEPKLQQFRRP